MSNTQKTHTNKAQGKIAAAFEGLAEVIGRAKSGTFERRKSSKALSRKNRCSDSRSTGGVPDSTDTGLINSAGE